MEEQMAITEEKRQENPNRSGSFVHKNCGGVIMPLPLLGKGAVGKCAGCGRVVMKKDCEQSR